MAEIVKLIALRPITFFAFLTLVVLLLPSVIIPIWYQMMKNIEKNVGKETSYASFELIKNFQDVAKLIPPINSSAIDLSNVLNIDNTRDKLLFPDIQKEVAPALFISLLVIPHLIQASYIGLDGLFFSYIKVDDQIFALYSNSTFANNLDHYTWYTQLVKSTSGELLGEANITKPLIVINEIWFKVAMDSPNGYASLGSRWYTNDGKESSILFLDTARLGRAGAISLGFSSEEVTTFFSSTNLLDASLYMATLGGDKVLMDGIKDVDIKIKNDKALVQGSNQTYIGEISCNSNNNGVTNIGGTALDIGGANFIFYCSSIDVARVPMVYVLAYPSNRLIINVHNHTKVELILLIIMLIGMIISVFMLVTLVVRAARREVHLRAAYMKEMEKTAQAERKSIKQSLAFASANHDVRGYLACIKGLTELSASDLSPFSQVASNLRKIDTCVEDLLALVNSILDYSKIEAGKMQLDENEFNLAQLLEDDADLHHPVAMKKGVEVILDPCDGSIFKYSLVRGDRGKLKQILGNLLSNAIKFTSQGSICIKCQAKKPSFENPIVTSDRLSNDLEDMKIIKQDSNCMEFEFMVEDTGPGIPKDKRGSIFENFVQVKENSAGQVGTGLGLGIVQSLVKLMGGDIEIVDKANGEQGTCFKFNIFFIVQEECLDNPRQELIEHRDINSGSGLSACVRSPRGEKSLVILLMKNDARRGMIHRYMENLGVNLKVLSQGKQLSPTLKKVKSMLIDPLFNSSSGRSDTSPPRGTYLSNNPDRSGRGGSKLPPLNMMECILLVIDCNAGDDFQKMQRLVSEFRKDLYMTCIKVVWLGRPGTSRAKLQGLPDESLPSTDLIISEPLHGSRLLRIVNLLPEFGGDSVRSPTSGRSKRSNTSVAVLISNTQSETEEDNIESSDGEIKLVRNRRSLQLTTSGDNYAHEQEVPQVLMSSSPSMTNTTQMGEIQEVPRDAETEKSPLEGKKILLVEDHMLQRMLAEACVKCLGAETQTCENGEEALEVVCKALSNQQSGEPSKFPYDFIIMDCEMPVMTGFEATQKIREEEKKYGVHIPIIALSAHEVDGEEGRKIAEAGMDFHLTKPLRDEELLKVLQNLL
ncbi:histidine kinase CKI1-like [Chenopodium quinoa]|uniref:histidine kinase n=1 Tax=Chenopodium quinoa TaxID=63459 RepID=A0A803M7J5_CHEQI|nr:histidine kinase CKI1-like [Chenopodium quinoa]